MTGVLSFVLAVVVVLAAQTTAGATEPPIERPMSQAVSASLSVAQSSASSILLPASGSYTYDECATRAETPTRVSDSGASASVAEVSATRATGGGAPGHQTTILGENMADRVMPFAERTNARTLGFGASSDDWARMTPQQRYKLNDGQLRARINEGDDFRYIGQDPARPPMSAPGST